MHPAGTPGDVQEPNSARRGGGNIAKQQPAQQTETIQHGDVVHCYFVLVEIRQTLRASACLHGADSLRNSCAGAFRTGIWIAKAAQHRFGLRARQRGTSQRRQVVGHYADPNRTALTSVLPKPNCFSRALLVALPLPLGFHSGLPMQPDQCRVDCLTKILDIKYFRKCRDRIEIDEPNGSSIESRIEARRQSGKHGFSPSLILTKTHNKLENSKPQGADAPCTPESVDAHEAAKERRGSFATTASSPNPAISTAYTSGSGTAATSPGRTRHRTQSSGRRIPCLQHRCRRTTQRRRGTAHRLYRTSKRRTASS